METKVFPLFVVVARVSVCTLWPRLPLRLQCAHVCACLSCSCIWCRRPIYLYAIRFENAFGASANMDLIAIFAAFLWIGISAFSIPLGWLFFPSSSTFPFVLLLLPLLFLLLLVLLFFSSDRISSTFTMWTHHVWKRSSFSKLLIWRCWKTMKMNMNDIHRAWSHRW